MTPLIVIGALAGLALAIWLTIRTTKRQRRAQLALEKERAQRRLDAQRAELAALIERAEAGDHAVQDRLLEREYRYYGTHFYKGDDALRSRFFDLLMEVRARHHFELALAEIRKRLDPWRQASDVTRIHTHGHHLLELFDKIAEGDRPQLESEVGLTVADIVERLNRVAHDRLDELFAQSANDASAIHLAVDLIRSINGPIVDKRIKQGLKRLKHPEGWNQRVVEVVANPHLYHFVGLPEQRDSGELALLAVKALRKPDIYLLKIIWSYAQTSWGRAELQPELYTRVAEAVDAYNLRSQLIKAIPVTPGTN
jgi:hypothetical protein